MDKQVAVRLKVFDSQLQTLILRWKESSTGYFIQKIARIGNDLTEQAFDVLPELTELYSDVDATSLTTFGSV